MEQEITEQEERYYWSYDRDTWMENVLYLNGSGHRVSGHADENDHDRWTGKHHYAALFSTVPMEENSSRTRFSGGNWSAVDSLRLVIYTSWKTREVPRVSCSHEIYRGLRSPLFRKGCKRRAAAARRSSSAIRYIFYFTHTFFISRTYFIDANIKTITSNKQIINKFRFLQNAWTRSILRLFVTMEIQYLRDNEISFSQSIIGALIQLCEINYTIF